MAARPAAGRHGDPLQCHASLPRSIVVFVVLMCCLVVAMPYILAYAGFEGAAQHLQRKQAQRDQAAAASGQAGGAPGAAAQEEVAGGGAIDAIIVAGGGQTQAGPPEHVRLRLQKAKEIYDAQAPRPFIITTGRGTWHRPSPRDGAGNDMDESSQNAKWLVDNGVSPKHILTEGASMETVGNAFFARVNHCDVLGLTRITVVNNKWHMPRTRAVFDHVFGVTPPPSGAYRLSYAEAGDGLAPDVLALRLERERASTPRFSGGSHWRAETSTLRELHRWMYSENLAYAATRRAGVRVDEGAGVDPKTALSY